MEQYGVCILLGKSLISVPQQQFLQSLRQAT